MTTKKTTQAQHDAPSSDASPEASATASSNFANPFFPSAFTQPMPGMDVWTQAVDAHLARCDQAFAQMLALQRRGAEQSTKAVDEMARLAKEAMSYGV